MAMTPAGFALVIAAIFFAAGVLGALVGLGGGIIVVLALAFLFGGKIQTAIAASIISVIATSSGAAASHRFPPKIFRPLRGLFF